MMIYNKSHHPVEIKRIPVRVWALRDEIEAALHRRIKECEALQIPLFVEDIKKYYSLDKSAPIAENNVIQIAKAEVAPPDNIDKADEILAKQSDETTPVAVEKNPLDLLPPYSRQSPNIEHISYGFSFLADINMTTMLIFSKEKFIPGQNIVIEFLIPNHFTQSAKIIKCNNYAMRSRIISDSKPDYRLQCSFSFDLSGERGDLRAFLKSVEPTIGAPPKKVSKNADDASLE